MALRVYTVAVWLYAGVYLLALALLAAARIELAELQGFSAAQTLAPLGLPWTLLWDGPGGADGPWLPLTAPLANLLLIGAVRRSLAAD